MYVTVTIHGFINIECSLHLGREKVWSYCLSDGARDKQTVAQTPLMAICVKGTTIIVMGETYDELRLGLQQQLADRLA